MTMSHYICCLEWGVAICIALRFTQCAHAQGKPVFVSVGVYACVCMCVQNIFGTENQFTQTCSDGP